MFLGLKRVSDDCKCCSHLLDKEVEVGSREREKWETVNSGLPFRSTSQFEPALSAYCPVPFPISVIYFANVITS